MMNLLAVTFQSSSKSTLYCQVLLCVTKMHYEVCCICCEFSHIYGFCPALFIHLFTSIEGPMIHHPKRYFTFYNRTSNTPPPPIEGAHR